MIEISLPKGLWRFDPAAPLGPAGGFGAVFAGASADGDPVAVKRLHINAAAAAHRELAIADELAKRAYEHIMPVLDSGQDAQSDGYYVVMPIADRSLDRHITDSGTLTEEEAVSILRAIAKGLLEAANIVHRDLKPGNVLLHAGTWKIADFGIARFVEDSTSARTLKDALSPAYAAPEQWRLERASPRTDVYALGCVAHTAITGTPPFAGALDELREAHLHATPPVLPEVDQRLRGLVAMMLRKSPDARPSAQRAIEVLDQVVAKPIRSEGALTKLAAAGVRHEQAQSAAEAEQARKQAEKSARAELVSDASAILGEIAIELADRVKSGVPNANVRLDKQALTISIGDATLSLDTSVSTHAAGSFKRSKWDVIAGASIKVAQIRPYHERSASLWYTRQNHAGADYRWYEVGYMGNPFMGRFQYQPAAGDAEIADRAHSNAVDAVQAAYGPVVIDGEHAESFADRWLNTLAAACDGRLQDLGSGFPHFA